MHNNIVEGEPGIFPDPIARLLVRLGRLGRREKSQLAAPPPQASTTNGPEGAGEPGQDPEE